MRAHAGSVLMLTLCTTLLGSTRLTSQGQLPEPSFRIADARGRASRVRDSIARLPQETRAKYVHIDTTRGGVTWIQFDPTAHVTHSQTPEAAAAQFLAVYATPVLGIDATHGRLELLREHVEGNGHHFRYVQRHAGYRVLHGQWLVHVRRGSGGYAVEAANGWVFPDIGAPIAPSLGRTSAENAAVWGLRRASVVPSDTAPVILAHDGLYRMAYQVSVFDAERGMSVTRYVDAINGAVFAESPSASDDAPNRKPSASPSARATPRRSSSLLATNGVMLGSFVTTSGLDWDGNSRQFNVWQESANDFRLRDNQHAAAASEIQVRDLASADIHAVCDNADAIVQGTSITSWQADTDPRNEEVSAVHNLGEVLNYFYSKGLAGMRNNSAILTGCVHGTASVYNASYDPVNYALRFRRATGNDAPSAAAIDGVGHEFSHGVHQHLLGEAPGSGSGPDAVDGGLADFWGARIRNNMRCARGGYINATAGCQRYLDVDSMFTVGYCETESLPHSGHCLGIRLSSALLDATEVSSGYYANEIDFNVFWGTANYIESEMIMEEAVQAINVGARSRAHALGGKWVGAADSLENRFYSNGLQTRPAVKAQLSGVASTSYTLTLNVANYVFDLNFEWGSQGLNADGSVAPLDSPAGTVALGELYIYQPVVFGYDEVDYHSCSDGHYHSFRLTTVDAENPALTYYVGLYGCGGGNLIAGPQTTDALPTRFAVRQAIQPPSGSAALSGTPPALTLGAQIRAYGVTAVDVDIPVGTVPVPIEVTVYNPQGRMIRRFLTDRLGPGTQRVPWDRKDDGGRSAPPGVYVVLVQHGGNRLRTHFVIPAER